MPHSSGCIEVEVASNFWKSSNENQGTFESETLAGILTCSLRGGRSPVVCGETLCSLLHLEMLARVALRAASRAAPLRALGTKAAAGKPLPSGTLAAVHPRPGSEGRRLHERQAGREHARVQKTCQ